MKSQFLTTPVWLGIALALAFPYYGLAMSKWGFLTLLALSFSNLFFFEFRKTWRSGESSKGMFFYLFIGYVLWPCLQMILAKTFIQDPSLQLGVLMASIAPVAIVGPQFLPEKSRDRAITYILLSTLFFPLICFSYLKILGFERWGVQVVPLVRDTFILTFLPLIISFLVEILAPSLKSWMAARTQKVIPWINMIFVGFLIFVYFGSAFAKTNLSEIGYGMIFGLILMALFQDFGLYSIMKWLKFPREEQICFSMKNVALSGGVLLVFHPQSILACSIVFVAHALLFTVLLRKSKS